MTRTIQASEPGQGGEVPAWGGGCKLGRGGEDPGGYVSKDLEGGSFARDKSSVRGTSKCKGPEAPQAGGHSVVAWMMVAVRV